NKDRWSPNLERLLFSVLFLLYVSPHNVPFEYEQLLFLSKSDVWQYTPVHHQSRYDGREFLSLLQPVLHSDTERNIFFPLYETKQSRLTSRVSQRHVGNNGLTPHA